MRAAAGAAVLAILVAATAGCVVAVRPAPVGYYAAPPEEFVADAPPAPIAEVVGVAPGPGFVWIGGYYHWLGGRWVWYRGRYERPPHPGARWYGPRYVLRAGRRVYIHGYWR